MTDLVQRWAAGDAAAGEALYRGYFARVRDYIVSRGEKHPDAEDIAQEALIVGLDGLRDGQVPEQLTGWILGIARHLQSRRTRLVLRDLESVDPRQRSVQSKVIRREMGDLLGGVLKTLSPTDRRVLELLHHGGLSRKEVAERLQVDVEAVHSRLARLEGKLREALSKHFTTLAVRELGGRTATLEAIRALRPLFREPVILRHLDDLSEVAAARRLGVPSATLRARLRSAYELLGVGDAPDFSKAREEHRRCRGTATLTGTGLHPPLPPGGAKGS